MENVIIAQISYHYEERPTILHDWTRERYARQIARDKGKHSDWKFKRVTPKKANLIREEQYRKELKESYTRAIAEKYNMPMNWQDNRWFVEQVRPTI